MQDPVLHLSAFTTVISLFIIVLLLFLLGFINAVEVAFFSLKPSQLKEIRINSSDKDDLVASLLQYPKRLLATILITVNFLNVSIVILSTFISHSLMNTNDMPLLAFFIQIVVVTIIILFFGEILPKVYASQHGEKVAILMAKPMDFLVRALYPISQVMIVSTQFVDKRIAKKYANISMSELEEAIDITTDENTPEDERNILKGIVNFGETEVGEIMKSRVFITAVENSLNFKEMIAVVKDSGYSRIPVYEEKLDKVTGTLYIKDLLPHISEDENFNWQKLIRPAFFVPENKKINDLLQDFQRKKIHLAIVVDEYGGTSGIITLEDVIEEIVGEINDEFDTDAEGTGYSKLDDHTFYFQGEIPINDFCRIMKVDPDIFDKVKGESGTLAGLILEMTRKMPEPNDKVSYGRFVFRIESVDERRIQKIKVSLQDASIE